MAEKTHIVKQEEGITENSMQIRAGEPIALKDPHFWLDTNSNRVYLHAGGQVYAIANGEKSIDMASATSLDAKQGQTFHKTITANTTLTVNNLTEEGARVKVAVLNSDGSNRTIGFSGITIANVADMVTTVRAGRIAVYEFLFTNGQVYCLFPVRTESVFA